MSDLAPLIELVQHAPQAAGHIFEEAAPNIASHAINRLVDRLSEKFFGGGLEERVRDSIDVAHQRMDSVLEDIYVRLSSVEQAVADAAFREPATITFVERCLVAASETPDVGKQMLFGDFIIERLGCATESFDDLTLRQSRRIVSEANAPQLLALVRIMCVTDPPLSFSEPKTFEAVEDIFRRIEEASDGASTAWKDMQYLVSINAMTKLQNTGDASASIWMNYLLHWEKTYDVALPYQEMHALENRIRKVRLNRSQSGSRTNDGVPYGMFELSPAGFKIARNLVARLCPRLSSDVD